MASLKKRVSNYLRQLSFHNESRERRSINENSFITRYLEGGTHLRNGPQIYSGKNPSDLPNLELDHYECGYESIIGCYTGPDGGLTTIKRTEKHLSVLEKDIDFIDTPEEEPVEVATTSTQLKRPQGQPVDNSTMIIKVAGQEYCVTNRAKKHSKSHSLGSMSDFNMEIERTRIDRDLDNKVCPKSEDHRACASKRTASHDSLLGKCDGDVENRPAVELCKDAEEATAQSGKDASSHDRRDAKVTAKHHRKVSSSDKPIRPLVGGKIGGGPQGKRASTKSSQHRVAEGRPSAAGTAVSGQQRPPPASTRSSSSSADRNYALSKSRSENSAAAGHGKRGKIIKVGERPHIKDGGSAQSQATETYTIDESKLPAEWNRKSEVMYGLSDSLYDKNQVTKIRNGNPIADCFGVIARRDSAILAVADGVNWGEKACLAAKSAVHGCLYYLNKTLFDDTKLFDKLTSKSGNADFETKQTVGNSVANTREVFVSLLRAFTCAHDLILENEGMLTTLTVAVVLPLPDNNPPPRGKSNATGQYVCCVCNVGDTLAYVYSLEHGIREITKGSHDITSNRDMRDALGALGPVDGVNPELSNLTISLTKLQKGDIVMVASDGLTDNFDPNVCRFATNSSTFNNKVDRGSQSKANKDRQPDNKSSKNVHPAGASRKSKENIRLTVEHNVKDLPRSETKKASVQIKDPTTTDNRKPDVQMPSSSSDRSVDDNPLVQQFLKDNALDSSAKPPQQGDSRSNVPHDNYKLNKSSSYCKPSTQRIDNLKKNEKTTGYKFMRSKTSVDFSSSKNRKQILRDTDGLPFVSPIQRYELQLLLMEEILKSGISGRDASCTTSKKLCENLVNFTFSITAAKRHSLEDTALYFDNNNGLLVEVSSPEKKIRRKRAMEKFQHLPGKLDHVTLVAYNVGNTALKT